MACRPPWYTDDSDAGASPCPYGTAVHGFDVTIPTHTTFADGLCIFYSFLPVKIPQSTTHKVAVDAHCRSVLRGSIVTGPTA